MGDTYRTTSDGHPKRGSELSCHVPSVNFLNSRPSMPYSHECQLVKPGNNGLLQSLAIVDRHGFFCKSGSTIGRRNLMLPNSPIRSDVSSEIGMRIRYVLY